MAELQIHKIAAQKIPQKQLGGDDISEALRAALKDQLGGIRQRWKSPRGANANKERRPLLTSHG